MHWQTKIGTHLYYIIVIFVVCARGDNRESVY